MTSLDQQTYASKRNLEEDISNLIVGTVPWHCQVLEHLQAQYWPSLGPVYIQDRRWKGQYISTKMAAFGMELSINVEQYPRFYNDDKILEYVNC